MVFMKKPLSLLGLLLIVTVCSAQTWTLKDSGVGLIVEDRYNNKPPKVARRGTSWNTKELNDNGALEGKYYGNQLFAAWIQGPETKEFLNSKGMPVWTYHYRITYPDGKTFESDIKDFSSSGFSYFDIKLGAYTEGVWEIEWFIYNRDTKKSIQVATTVFQTTRGNS
jgi:hypothetical protein